MKAISKLRVGTLSAAVAAAVIPTQVWSQELTLEEVLVTATRRSESIQDIPLNITALGGLELQRKRIGNLADMARFVPGMTLVDQGPRHSDLLIVRGLNIDSLSSPEQRGNQGGNTVGLYLGEIPLYIDLKLNDIKRVEVLMGPQGTLYGQGTIGGAVRYLPNRPQADRVELVVSGEAYDISKGSDIGFEGGATVNLPLIEDRLAFRASVNYTDDPGFIDSNFLVREAGVSNPQPDFSDPADVAANLRRQADTNTEETLSARMAMRYLGDRVDVNLSYHYQNMDVGGRQINHRAALGTGDYESAMRFLEPSERENQLLALELVADLGFAELTSATGVSEYDEQGQRDQTDLLLDLDYGYEGFPSFSAFTREDVDQDRFNQELRLVSTSENAFGWIVGAFYNRLETSTVNQEFTPGYDQFLVDVGAGVQLRPDALEYFEVLEDEITERAIFGEISYQFSDAWQGTLGARFFDYEQDRAQSVDFPLADTVFGGRTPVDLIIVELAGNKVDDDGSLFKFNTSYRFNDDLMAYVTVSEGYRLGGLNALPECTDLDEFQNACAKPDEVLIKPDTTVNYELGWHSSWADKRVVFNGALYYIDWDDIQIAGVTDIGQIPITKNGGTARSLGVEMSGRLLINEMVSLSGNYAYVDAELTSAAPGLENGLDGVDGDRLPGTPEHQASLAVNYGVNLSDGARFEIDWAMALQSDVITKVGQRNSGETLAGYALHNVSATWARDNWTLTLYGDNVLDKFTETSVRLDRSFVRPVGDFDLRRFYTNVGRPRQLGLRAVYRY